MFQMNPTTFTCNAHTTAVYNLYYHQVHLSISLDCQNRFFNHFLMYNNVNAGEYYYTLLDISVKEHTEA